jgi:bifunctional DNase/RNase
MAMQKEFFFVCLMTATLVGVQSSALGSVNPRFIEVSVKGVLRDPQTGNHVVVLEDKDGHRAKPIRIGEAEAQALEAATRGISDDPSLTHDLLVEIFKWLDVHPVEVRITEVRDSIFYAFILVERKGRWLLTDARPSDALVLALRTDCPIYVVRSMLESYSVSLESARKVRYGLTVQELTEALKVGFDYAGEGVLISAVEPKSDAARDGLLRGDILVQIKGIALRRVQDVEAILDKATGVLVSRIYRDGWLISLVLYPNGSDSTSNPEF